MSTLAFHPPVAVEGWRLAAVRTGTAVLAITALFARDVGDLVRVWTEDATYNHCLLVAPIAAILVWLRRRELARLTPGVWMAPLLLVTGAALAWTLGELAGVAQVRQLALVAMIQGAIAVCLGQQVTRGLLFPLGFLLFLVPFGAELAPPLQQLTARIATTLLALTGIPARLDGVFITTPAGWFEVAEACSGISFLIATIAWGALVANLLFTSAGRRTAFVAACVVLPILANGVRAWVTVAAASWVGVARAAGVDHLIYGWVFFALVLVLLMAGGWRFFERTIDDPAFNPGALSDRSPGEGGALSVVAVVALPLAAAALATVLGSWGERPMPVPIALPAVPGWTRVPADPNTPAWTPHYDGADHYLSGSFRDPVGRTVELAIALFRSQREGRELVGYGQGAVPPGGDWMWVAPFAAPNGATGVRMVGPDRTARAAWTVNVVGGRPVAGGLATKVRTLAGKLTLADPAAGALIVSTAGEGSDATTTLADFVRALGSPEVVVARLIADSRAG